jgi:hypothetical protein
MSENDFWTMREIGYLFGETSHAIGRKLKELGLRTPDGKPSRLAFKAGLCKKRWTSDGLIYFWVWHGERTARLLEESGLCRRKVQGEVHEIR